MGVSAKVITDSKFRDTRLLTLEVELHRFVLSEFNTHRMISRNFQSSRAVPISKMIEQVRTDPALPVHWGKNQPGMQAEQELTGTLLEEVQTEWKMTSMYASDVADWMNKVGVAKQLANRILEPFMWTKGVVTATERDWNNFFLLRLHKDAQPEIQALAKEIKSAIDNSSPVVLKSGEWHTPYADACDFPPSEYGLLRDAIGARVKVSASCCAQVSYRKLDDSLEKATKIYDMLNLPVNGVYPEDPPHFSPTEHIAKAGDTEFEMSGNFQCNDFTQYRKVLEKGLEQQYLN